MIKKINNKTSVFIEAAEIPKKLHIISPGFSVDCLETLEEIKIQYDELFKESGGDSLTYIPCLNDHDDHIELIDKLIKVNMSDWRNEK